ncbi:MAG: M48 family metallopeptidase [Thermoplasmata archaeon]
MDATAPIVCTFTIDTELAKQQLLSFPKFVRESLAFGQLPGIRMGPMEAYASSDGHYMEFLAGPDRGTYQGLVRIHLDRPVRVEIRSPMGRDEAFEKQLENVLLFAIQFFEEQARKSMLYLGFVPGAPQTAQIRGGFSLFRALFSGNMLNIFLLSIVIGVFLFAVAGMYAPVLMIALMFALVMSAGKLSAMGSPWRITKDRREVVIVQYNVPEGQLAGFVGQNLEKVRTAKQRAYEMFSTFAGLDCSDRMAQIFTDAGLPADQKDFLVRRIDVYGIVERAAKKFGLPMPTISIMQEPKPNAAATGFTKSFATMIITMGLLVQLDEDEIEVVVGHELSHLRSADPIVLFSIVGVEYLARAYVYGQYIGALIFVYIIALFYGIFFVGKFLETRSDLEAGLILGKPKVMAGALKKIGFRRLIVEERFFDPGAGRLGEWLRFDPHPPLYFRIQRLEKLDLLNPPKHTLLTSIRDVLSGISHSGKAP